VILERHHREHRGVARGADRHGLALAELGRQPHQPLAFDARFLAVGAEMGFAQAPAIEDDLVAGLPVRVGRRFHLACEIDAGDHREAAHHRHLAGDGEAVLVVDGGPGNADGDVAVHQVGFVELGQGYALPLVGLLDHDRFELRHVRPPR
jgi:hypothetical protein